MIARNNLASVKQLLQEARNEVSVHSSFFFFLILKIYEFFFYITITARESV